MALEDADKSLFFAVLALLAVLLFQYPTQTIFDWVLLLDILAVSLFVILVLIYCTDLKKNGAVFGKIFWLYMICAILFIGVHLARYLDVTLVDLYYAAYLPMLYFIILMFLSLLMALAIYIWHKQKMYWLAVLLFLIVVAILYIYGESGYLINYISSNDEQLLTAHGVSALLNGTDPYNYSFSRLLYLTDLHNSTGYTLTTNDMIIGTMDYPSLFFLTFIPFYLLSPLSLNNLEYIDLPAQWFVFFAALFITIWYVIDKKDVLKPKPLLYLGIAILPSVILSITTYLMLALIILAYAKLKSRYSWVILGVAASLQQELWIPVLLLIAYSFNTYGLRKGARDLFGAAAVFLLFNGYFILVNAPAYFNSIFLTLDGLLIPSSVATFGYFLFTQYHLTLGVFTLIFECSVVFVLLLSLYFNKKTAIPVLCLLPFLLSDHAIISYYYFFASFFAIALYCGSEKHEVGFVRRAVDNNSTLKYLCALLLLGIFAVLAVSVVSAHNNYIAGSDLQVENQTAVQIGNLTHYSGILHYNAAGMDQRNFYIILIYYNSMSKGRYGGGFGLGNVSIINNSLVCGYPCAVNPNLIELNASNHTYTVNAYARNISGTTYISVFIYNGIYAYQSQMINVNGLGPKQA